MLPDAGFIAERLFGLISTVMKPLIDTQTTLIDSSRNRQGGAPSRCAMASGGAGSSTSQGSNREERKYNFETSAALRLCVKNKFDISREEALSHYRELGLDVPVRGDHVPEMAYDRVLTPDGTPGYFTLGRLFANGYLKALLRGTGNPCLEGLVPMADISWSGRSKP